MREETQQCERCPFERPASTPKQSAARGLAAAISCETQPRTSSILVAARESTIRATARRHALIERQIIGMLRQDGAPVDRQLLQSAHRLHRVCGVMLRSAELPDGLDKADARTNRVCVASTRSAASLSPMFTTFTANLERGPRRNFATSSNPNCHFSSRFGPTTLVEPGVFDEPSGLMIV